MASNLTYNLVTCHDGTCVSGHYQIKNQRETKGVKRRAAKDVEHTRQKIKKSAKSMKSMKSKKSAKSAKSTKSTKSAKSDQGDVLDPSRDNPTTRPPSKRKRLKPKYYSHEILTHPDQAVYFEGDLAITVDELDDEHQLDVDEDEDEEDADGSQGSLRSFIDSDDNDWSDSEYNPTD